MSNFIDITGRKFNHLTVIKRLENTQAGKTVWECLCDCGNITVVRGANLKNGSVKSCGCLLKLSKTKSHGMSGTRLYGIWCKMRSRCTDPSDRVYVDYGGREISVCDSWNNDFSEFMNWSLDNGYSDNLTIDRIDNNGNYEPSNCRWVDREAQANNRRSCLFFLYNGKKKNLRQWCSEYNVNYSLVHNRIRKLHWSFEKALFTPVDVKKRNKK